MPRAAKNPTAGLTPKQEAFCLEYLKCGNASEAYRKTYDTKGSEKTINEKASRLLNGGKIRARLELLQRAVTDAAMQSAAVDKDWVMRRLKIVAERCLQARPVLDRKGAPVFTKLENGKLVPAFVFDAAGANRALELLGKEIGMFIEKKEAGKPGEFGDKAMEEKELRERIKERSVKLGLAKVVPIGENKAKTT